MIRSGSDNKKSMQIGIVSPGWPSVQDPYKSVFVRRLCDAMAKCVSVSVIAPKKIKPSLAVYDDKSQQRDARDGYSVFEPRYISFSNINFQLFSTYRLSMWSYSRAIGRCWDKEFGASLNGLYAHFLTPTGFAAVDWRAKCAETFSIVVGVGESDPYKIERYFSKGKIHQYLNLIDALVFPSRATAISFRARYNLVDDKIYVVPNAVEDCMFSRGDGMLARKALGLPLNNKIVLYVGTNHKRKGLDAVLSTAEKLSSEDIMFVLVGKGTESIRLSNVLGVGVQDPEVLSEYYRAADALILPTEAEGFSNVVLEACATGLPVVTTAIPQHVEYFGETYPYLCINPKDIGCFTDKVRQAVVIGAEMPSPYTYEQRARKIVDICLERFNGGDR